MGICCAGSRAEYGKETVERLAADLSVRYVGAGMMQAWADYLDQLRTGEIEPGTLRSR